MNISGWVKKNPLALRSCLSGCTDLETASQRDTVFYGIMGHNGIGALAALVYSSKVCDAKEQKLQV